MNVWYSFLSWGIKSDKKIWKRRKEREPAQAPSVRTHNILSSFPNRHNNHNPKTFISRLFSRELPLEFTLSYFCPYISHHGQITAGHLIRSRIVQSHNRAGKLSCYWTLLDYIAWKFSLAILKHVRIHIIFL